MEQVSRIKKKRFGNEWKERMWFFHALVWSVVGFEVEILGWKELKELQFFQFNEKYLKC